MCSGACASGAVQGCCSVWYGAAQQLRLASTFQLLAHPSTADEETLFLPIFRPREGHSLNAHSAGPAQTPTTNLQTGADTGPTSSPPSIKDGEPRRWRASFPHHVPPCSQSFCDSQIFPLFPPAHFARLLSPLPALPPSSPRHVVLPSVPAPRLVTSPSPHPRLPRDTKRGWQPALPKPCGYRLLGHLIFTTERNISRRIGRTFNWKWKFYDSSHSAPQITPAEKTWKQMNNL